MARLVKILLILVAAFVGVGVLASVVLMLFFDPNDFRDDIAKAVEEKTGRELVIEGDLKLSIFPWIAVEIGRTRLGNAAGFGDDPFMSFEDARLSVRLIPLLLRQEITVGTASLDSLTVNLTVNKSGVSNWQDLAEAGDRVEEPAELPPEDGRAFKLDVANVKVSNANVRYTDAKAGSSAALSNLSMETGRIAAGEPFDLQASFAFETQPDGVGGELGISGTVLLGEDFGRIDIDGLNVSGDLRGIAEQPTEFNFDARAIGVDLKAERIEPGEMDMRIFDVGMTAKVEPFSYAGEPMPVAELQVREFSLKDLMRRFGSEPPATADPNALGRVSFSAKAAVQKNDIALSNMKLTLDDTHMDGKLSLPKRADGPLGFDLHVDSMVVDNYMAPASDESATPGDEGEANVEIPVDLIRALNASGSFRMDRAMLAGIVFEDLQLTLNSKDGLLRLHPIGARMFSGEYKGDVRIDARSNSPVIAVDENIVGVQLASLVEAMYGVKNVSGTIDGRFQLTGKGADLDAIRRDLDGQILFRLADGAYLGTDVWYELRRARALLRQEQPPAPRLPARTEFSSVSLSGKVTNGVMQSDDLLAELPFLRLTGQGSVSFTEATINYAMQARVVERPEFAGQASEQELKDFTSAVIPLKVSGPLTSPKVVPDIEGLVRREVERQVEKKTEEIKKQLLDKLLGGKEKPAEGAEGQEGTEEGQQDEEEQQEEEQDPEEKLKEALKDIFGG